MSTLVRTPSGRTLCVAECRLESVLERELGCPREMLVVRGLGSGAVSVSVRGVGGKQGAFGQNLRRAAGPVTKTKNKDSCRTVDGVRLRVANQEKRLAEWRRRREERTARAEQQERDKDQESREDVPAPQSDQAPRKSVAEEIADAVAEGLARETASMKRTSEVAAVPVPTKRSSVVRLFECRWDDEQSGPDQKHQQQGDQEEHQEQSRTQHKHALVRTAHPYGEQTTWECDDCGESFDGESASVHCQECSYDLCESCFLRANPEPADEKRAAPSPAKTATSSAATTTTTTTAEDAASDPQPSRLGTLEYWESVYDRESANFRDNGEDIGEVWFGEACARKVAGRASALFALEGEETLVSRARVLDVGCGNAFSLIELHRRGFRDLTGTDYSPASIDHSRQVLATEGVQARLLVDDFTATSLAPDSFDLVHDKGTYDAISLAEDAKDLLTKYRSTLSRVLAPGGYFIITSCNFSRDELLASFSSPVLTYHSHLDYPVLSFGGHQGSTNATVLFRRPPPRH